jgi:hypothetical protein
LPQGNAAAVSLLDPPRPGAAIAEQHLLTHAAAHGRARREQQRPKNPNPNATWKHIQNVLQVGTLTARFLPTSDAHFKLTENSLLGKIG